MWPFSWFAERKRKKEAEKNAEVISTMPKGDSPCSCGHCSTKPRITPGLQHRSTTRIVHSGSVCVDDDGIDPVDVLIAAETAELIADAATPVVSAIGSGIASIVESVVEEASDAISDLFDGDSGDSDD